MNLKEQVTPEAISTDNRILLKSHARFFLLPAIASALLTAGVLFLIYYYVDYTWINKLDRLPRYIYYYVIPVTLLSLTYRFGWLASVYYRAPEWVLIDFESRMLTINPGKPDTRDILFDEILRIKYFYNLFYILPSFNFGLKMANGSKGLPMLLAMRSDPMSNALYFALQNKGGVEMQQGGISASVLRGKKPAHNKPGTDHHSPLKIQSSRNFFFLLDNPSRIVFYVIVVFLSFSIKFTWIIAVVIIVVIILTELINNRFPYKHSDRFWSGRLEFDPKDRVINEYRSGKTLQTPFDDIEYIRFEASSMFFSRVTDYLFWIKQNNSRERPLFAVTEDAAATEYYFILQNELGIPMRQD